MSTAVDAPSVRDDVVRAAAARLRTAATVFLQPRAAGMLPCDDALSSELRSSALRMVGALDGQRSRAALELVAHHDDRAAQALALLGGLTLHELSPEMRASLAAAIAALHSDLRDASDDNVTRALLDATPIGSLLAEIVFDTNPALLDPDAQVSYCQAAQRLESAAHARLGAGMVAFAGSNPRQTQYWVDGDEHTLTDVRASELASALTWTGNRARGAVAAARTVSGALDSAAQAASEGVLQPASVRVIADGAVVLTASIDRDIEQAKAMMRQSPESGEDIAQQVWDLTEARDEMLQRYDRSLTAYAANHTVAETRRKVRDTLAKLDPAGFAERREVARATQSNVELRPLPDSMAMFTAVLPAEHATACFRAVDGVARQSSSGSDETSLGVRRAEALYAFCARPHSPESAAAEPATTIAPHVTAHVDLIMTLDAFLGLSDTPADCVGSGPIPASAARDLLADADLVSVRRVLVDAERGHTLDVGVQRYVLNAAERAYILARDRICRRPGCNQPAHRCECDHATPFAEGGATRADNLGALCVRHHQEKTHGGWSIEDGSADGSCVFVSPLGRRYPHVPEPLLPWAVGSHAETLPSQAQVDSSPCPE